MVNTIIKSRIAVSYPSISFFLLSVAAPLPVLPVSSALRMYFAFVPIIRIIVQEDLLL